MGAGQRVGPWAGWALGLGLALMGCDDGAGEAPDAAPNADGLVGDMGAPDAAASPPACDPAEILGRACEEDTWDPAPVWIVAEIVFAVADEDGRVQGFDLDGVTTARGDDSGCGHRDFVSPDGAEGVDSQLATLWPLIEQVTGDAVDGLIQGAINEGTLLITLAVAGDGDEPAFALGKLAGAPLLGTDGRMLPYQTFAPDPYSEPTMAVGRWAEDGHFVGGGVDVVLPLDILSFELDMRISDARVDFRVQPDGSLIGVLGGGLQAAEFMAALDMAAVPQDLRDFVRTLMFQRADLAPDATGACQAVSTAMVFRAVPSFLADWSADVRPPVP